VTGIALGGAPLVLAASLGLVSFERSLVILGTAVCVALACAWHFRRRIGGYTGDCLGAAQQFCEIGIYAAFLANT
jgi:adenosylcobinamide-GDP ribazoletransferase